MKVRFWCSFERLFQQKTLVRQMGSTLDDLRNPSWCSIFIPFEIFLSKMQIFLCIQFYVVVTCQGQHKEIAGHMMFDLLFILRAVKLCFNRDQQYCLHCIIHELNYRDGKVYFFYIQLEISGSVVANMYVGSLQKFLFLSLPQG